MRTCALVKHLLYLQLLTLHGTLLWVALASSFAPGRGKTLSATVSIVVQRWYQDCPPFSPTGLLGCRRAILP